MTKLHARAAIVAVTLLGGCGGSQPSVAIPEAPSPAKTNAGGYLYVSNQLGYQVVLYRYDPKRVRVTEIGQSGFTYDQPAGSCSDAKGNVYVVASNGVVSTGGISEFAFGTLTVMRTLSDETGSPLGCSVDPTTGNLAVTNDEAKTTGPAQVLIFKKGSGNPKEIDACSIGNGTAGYDPKGNLWLECNGGYKDRASIKELRKGASAFAPVTFDETFYFMGAIQWDGKYLDVSFGSYYRTMGIYQTKVSHSALTTVHTIWFERGAERVPGCTNETYFGQWAMVSNKPDDLPSSEATQLIAGNGCARISAWKYPAGGSPVRSFKPPGTFEFLPNGVTYVTNPE